MWSLYPYRKVRERAVPNQQRAELCFGTGGCKPVNELQRHRRSTGDVIFLSAPIAPLCIWQVQWEYLPGWLCDGSQNGGGAWRVSERLV